ncbi:MAG: DUF1576 domain-containing protein [Oscillospiraceae bacterium]|nr:DUF1576 domain-containing protein [Oscillospiraceae bacterium]
MSKYFKNIHSVYLMTMLLFIIAAFIIDTPIALFEGMVAILLSPDILVTDYIQVGGLGAAILNSALTSLTALAMLLIFKHDPKSATISNLWLITGFAFLGKNPLNVLPIFLGCWLFAKFMKRDFNTSILTALVAASLSPVVTQKLFIGTESLFINIGLAILAGVVVGFIFDPMAKNIFKVHDGYNLYNGGLTAGLLAIIIVSVFGSYGIFYEMNYMWSSGNNIPISIFLVAISLWLMFVGFYGNRNFSKVFKSIFSLRKHQNDYYSVVGSLSYVNMGLLGLLCVAVSLIFDIQLSGLALGAIVSVIGFGANGKQLFSTVSLMLGVFLATLISPLSMRDPSVIVAFFFAACLSPIPAKFGFHWGIIAGMLHIHLATSLAVMTGGVNLYNSGVAAGFVTILLLPIIRAIDERKSANQ